MTRADVDLVDRIRRAIAAAGDPDRAQQQQAYMRSSMPYRGVTAPQLRAVLRPLLDDSAAGLATRETWVDTVLELWDHATHREERYAATALTGHRRYRPWQDAAALDLYRHQVVTGAWWDHVDEIASQRVGPILRADPTAVAPVLRRWAGDDDLWVRRAAILSQLASGSELDVDLLRDCIEPSLEDTDFFARKAIGWALRQHARTDPAWVREHVEALGDRLSPLSRREALKHL